MKKELNNSINKSLFVLAAELSDSSLSPQGTPCCLAIVRLYNYYTNDNIDIPKHLKFFEHYFEPNEFERGDFNVFESNWMRGRLQSLEQTKQDRVLALLFCDQLWQDEMYNQSKK